MEIYDVFISYRRSDGETLAVQVQKFLSDKGLRVFFDKRDMKDGGYFTTQIESNLRKAPHYILIASQDALKIRDGEDWVRKEIAIALKEYDQNQTERTITVLVPSDTTFPDSENLPEDIRDILKVQQTLVDMNGDWFDKVLRSVTGVNRCNLWYSAHRWLEDSKKEGGRFAHLHIDETLLSRTDGAQAAESLVQQLPLMEALRAANNSHCYLTGEGGIGKTTALLHIMNCAYQNRAYSGDCQIPLFVELSRAPDTYGKLYAGGRSSFIRRSVYRQIREDRSIKQISVASVEKIDEVFRLEEDVAVYPINTVFMQETKAPEYLLLLDGLNEVSTVRLPETRKTVLEMVEDEIRHIMDNCPNVRIVLTGRTETPLLENKKLCRCNLTGINRGEIKGYLKQHDFSENAISEIVQNTDLLEILKIPLFLTMYAALKNCSEIRTRGELLHRYYSERHTDDLYTQRGRLKKIEEDVATAAYDNQQERLTVDMQNFFLDFVLPELAEAMVRQKRFSLADWEMEELVMPLLKERDNLTPCGKFGTEAFQHHQSGRGRSYRSPGIVANEILRIFSANAIGAILNFCVTSLGILQIIGGVYSFAHQHIRDYFAAAKYINVMRLAVTMQRRNAKDMARDCLNQVLDQSLLPTEIYRFIGEILGEQYNQPWFRELSGEYVYGVPAQGSSMDRNLIDRALNVYRGRIPLAKEPTDKGYGVYNLLQIVRNVRGSLAGIDLSNLDLSRCRLNDVGLCAKGLPAKLRGAKVSGDSFFPAGHTATIGAIAFTRDEEHIVSADEDGNVKVWDATTGELTRAVSMGENICFLAYTDNGEKIVTVSSPDKGLFRACRVRLWDAETWELIAESAPFVGVRHVQLSPDGTKLLIDIFYKKYCVVRMEDMEIVHSFAAHDYTNSWTSTISYAGFLNDNTLIRSIKHKRDEYTCEIVDISQNQVIRTLPANRWIGGIASCSEANCGQIAVCINDGTHRSTLLIVDEKDGSVIKELGQRNSFICSNLSYSTDGQWLVENGRSIFRTSDYSLAGSFEGKLMFGTPPVAFNCSCDKVVSIDRDETGLRIYGLDSDSYQLAPLFDIPGISTIPAVKIHSSDKKYVVTRSVWNKLQLWDNQKKRLIKETAIDCWGGFEFSPQSDRILLHGISSSTVLSCPDLQLLARFPECRHFSPDWMYSYAFRLETYGEVDLYNAVIYKGNQQIFVTEPLYDNIDATTITFCNDRVLVREGLGIRSVYNLADGALRWTDSDCLDVALGANCVAAIKDGKLEISPLNIPIQLTLTVDISEPICGIGFSLDGKQLFYGDGDHNEALDAEKLLAPYTFGAQKTEDAKQTSGENTAEPARQEEPSVPEFDPILVPGLEAMDIDLRNLHKDSQITDHQKEILRQYGAVI